jgi:hypothetical protein
MELVSPDSIYIGHSSSQLLDARFSGCRCYLDYLLIRRTLKHAAAGSGGRALTGSFSALDRRTWYRPVRTEYATVARPWF